MINIVCRAKPIIGLLPLLIVFVELLDVGLHNLVEKPEEEGAEVAWGWTD
jgi:hypothetical protein